MPRVCRPSIVTPCLLLIGTLISLSRPAAAQSGTGYQDRYWLTAGIGYGTAPRDQLFPSSGLTAGVAITYQPSLFLVTLRTDALWPVFHGDLLGDAGLLVGLGTHGERAHASLAVGPALSGGPLDDFRESRSTVDHQVGLGIQAQVLSLPVTGLGFGLTGFANLNSRLSFGGVMLSFALGKVR